MDSWCIDNSFILAIAKSNLSLVWVALEVIQIRNTSHQPYWELKRRKFNSTDDMKLNDKFNVTLKCILGVLIT